MAEGAKKAASRTPRKATARADRPAAPAVSSAQVDGAIETSTAAMDKIGDMAVADGAGVADVGAPAGESNVTDELSGGGVAFGEFVKSVGLAVAAAQSELDKTLVATAKALSDQKINTVAVFEQVINDDGQMGEGIVHIQELPLTNYLMPTAYQWSRVYLEADMNVQEFNSRSGFNIQQKAFSADARISGQAGIFGASASGTAGMSYSNTGTSVDAAYGQDVAAGKLHMEATLEPRADVQLPRPFVLQKGPRMQLLVGAKVEIHEGNDPQKPVIGQEVTLTCELQKTDGSPLDGKELAINISDPGLNYTSSGKTDAQGKMTIKIKTTGGAYDPANPVRAIVRVSFGLVSQSVGIVV